MDWKRSADIKKLDEDRKLVFGWLSVAVDKSGNVVVDSQDDIIPEHELENAAYEFVLYSRRGDEMHAKKGVSRLVESMVFTREKQAALGIPEGVLPMCGWWVGFKVDDAEVWAKVKAGEYRAFSFGGRAVPVEA